MAKMRMLSLLKNQTCDLDYYLLIGEKGHVPLISRGPCMDDKFYRNRTRVLRELASEADPFIKKRLLRLANN